MFQTLGQINRATYVIPTKIIFENINERHFNPMSPDAPFGGRDPDFVKDERRG